MWALFKKIFIGCEHDYRLDKEIDTYSTEYTRRPYKTTKHFLCNKCAKHRKVVYK